MMEKWLPKHAAKLRETNKLKTFALRLTEKDIEILNEKSPLLRQEACTKCDGHHKSRHISVSWIYLVYPWYGQYITVRTARKPVLCLIHTDVGRKSLYSQTRCPCKRVLCAFDGPFHSKIGVLCDETLCLQAGISRCCKTVAPSSSE